MSSSSVVAAVSKSAAMWTLVMVCTSAFPKLICVKPDNAAVLTVVVVSVFVFVFALTTDPEIGARTLILLPLNVLPKSIAKVLPVGEPPRV